MTQTHLTFLSVSILAGALLPACSSSSPTPLVDARATVDAGPDGAGDAHADVTDSSIHKDAAEDTTEDTTDATEDEASPPMPPDADLDAGPCILEESSTLPHVRFAFRTSSCVFTLAQAAAGISIPYDLIVDEDVPGFVATPPYWYGSDDANLDITEVLSGGTQQYCLCDLGLPYPGCPTDDGGIYHPEGDASRTCDPVTIPAGIYHRAFVWAGHNWNGPSDTSTPEGQLFPAGDYELKLTTGAGTVGDGGTASAVARMRVRLVP